MRAANESLPTSPLARFADVWDDVGRRLNVRLALVAVGALYVMLTLGFLPVLLLEQNRDWWTFDVAAANLAAGQPIYPGFPLNLYPPSMALLWQLPLDGTLWLLTSLALVPLVALLAEERDRLAIVALVLLLPPLHYDLYTGNVTALYVAAIALALARPGWLGALFLGAIFAFAPKPALVPLLVLLLLRRPWSAIGVALAAGVVTLGAALLAGLDRHVQYLWLLIDTPGELSSWTTGNLGLARLGPAAVMIGLVAGVTATLAAARWASFDRAAVIAVGSAALVQPTLGFYYAALFAPAVVLLWRVDRLAGVTGAITVPLVSIASPVIGGVVLIGLGFVSELSARAADPAVEPLE